MPLKQVSYLSICIYFTVFTVLITHPLPYPPYILLHTTEKEKAAKEREMQLTLELTENIANTAHDMKSPACALSLAVGSLISTFHGKTRVDKEGCKFAMETMTGMMHTLSSLNTIINRSVVRDRTQPLYLL